MEMAPIVEFYIDAIRTTRSHCDEFRMLFELATGARFECSTILFS